MIEFGGYQLLEELHSSSRTIVHRARRKSDGQSVIIKRAAENLPRLFAILRHEYAILRDFRFDGVVASLGLELARGGLGLVREDVGGVSLARVSRTTTEARIEPREFLQTALELAEALAAVHAAGIIHKDVKPANILRCADGRVRLTDFSHASLLARETALPGKIEGTLAYISPEQTGRMNRSVDRRTDLYSLGATLYELLSGKPPFVSDDPLELVHSHIARRPPPLTIAPPMIAAIVQKLLEKNPEDRYISAEALAVDLRRCLESLRTGGVIEVFTPGQGRDGRDFQIPEKLYGREKEAAQIHAAFEAVAAGDTRLLMVAGPSGSGKTALVNEVQRLLARERGRFVGGKSDQFRRNEPYAALLNALQQLVRGLFALEADAREERKQALQAGLGEEAGVLIDVIPELARVLDPQPPARPLNPSEAKHRFRNVLIRFVRVFTTEPLVLFLDDLQWADVASLELIEALVDEGGPPRLLIVGAYRDNEVDATHPLRLSLRVLDAVNPVVELKLRPLGARDLDRLLSETLSPGDIDQPERLRDLREIVMSKTAGNPFFVNQFLRTLYQDELIVYSGDGWRWDDERIRQAGFTDNVIDLMTNRVKRLPRETRGVLQTAAALGNVFGLNDLAGVEGRASQAVFEDLWPALKAGMLLPLDENYKQIQRLDAAVDAVDASASTNDDENQRDVGAPVLLRFLHDRVQQAAYALIPEEDLAGMHLRIGRSLLNDASHDGENVGDETDGESVAEQIFEIVGHLNPGLALLDRAERVRLARLNLYAARRARRSAAHSVAGTCARAGLAALGADAAENYETAFALMVLNGEALYLVGEYERAEQEFARALAFARGEYDRVQVHTLQTILLTLRGEFQSAIEVGRAGLALLGEELQLENINSVAFRRLMLVRKQRGKRSFEDLLQLPEMTDQRARALLQLYVEMTAAAYFLDTALAGLFAMNITLLSLEYGVTSGSAWGFINVGTFSVMLNQTDEAIGWGKLALDLNERLGGVENRCRLLCMYGFYLSHWKRPARETRAILDEAFRYGEQTGDTVYASYALAQDCLIRFEAGADLEELARDLQQRGTLFERRQFIDGRLACDSLRLLLSELRADPPGANKAPALDYKEFLERLDRSEMAMIRHMHLVHEMQRLYLAGDFAAVLETAERAAQLSYLSAAQMHLIEENLFESLAIIEYLQNDANGESRSVGAERRLELRERVAKNQKQLAIRAADCPENFRQRHLLVEAGGAALDGDTLKAIDLFEAAIYAAGEAGTPNVQALACEAATRFALRDGRKMYARTCANEAYQAWLRWGATARARAWRDRMSELFGPAESGTSDSSSESVSLDLSSILKAARAISGEIVLDTLIERVLTILLESAGAERGCVILERGGEWTIVARGDIEGAQHTAESLLESNEVPRSILHHSMRSRETVVLHDAQRSDPFQRDEYVRRVRVASVMCVPLEHQSKLVGVIYLENNLVQNAFGPERVQIVTMLCAQAAISIDNAVLYDELEMRVRERTGELELAREAAERSRQDILNLNEFSKRVNAATRLDDVLDQIFSYIKKHYAIEGILAGTVTPDRKELRFHKGDFPPEFSPDVIARLRRMPAALEANGSSAARAIFRKRPVHLPRLSRMVHLALEIERIYIDQGVRSMLMVPLIVRNESIGLLMFFTMKQAVNLRAILPNIDSFCEQIAGAVYSANLLAEVAAEREKSDRLLLNILPEQAARELKERGEVEPQFYESVTVMFSDFQGFTSVAKRMLPVELVKELNQLFHQFDSICERHNVEKLKTIGDAYMCAGGLPETNATHTIDVCLAALEMMEFVHGIAEIKRELHGEKFWRMRIGLHTGPVMAGVVGKRKFAYDIWGDAVNVASRCESNGEADRINLSEDAYERVKEFFVCEHRGLIQVKNRGSIGMYFLNGIRPEYSVDGRGRVPNAAFRERYEALRRGG